MNRRTGWWLAMLTAAEAGKLELRAKAIREKQDWQAHGPEH